MALTMTKINEKLYLGPGNTGQEYSITFDTAYPATGGESLAFGSNTNFASKVRQMIITKKFGDTNEAFVPELVPSTVSSSAKLKLYFLRSSSTNASVGAWVEVSTTASPENISGRAIFVGY